MEKSPAAESAGLVPMGEQDIVVLTVAHRHPKI
jgi:hypothetical protein